MVNAETITTPATTPHAAQTETPAAVAEAAQLRLIMSLPHDCKKCGEPSEYARMYGCPAGNSDCPYEVR